MTMSETVEPLHLARKAVIYIRQSSPHQVLTHRESLQLQYALRQRALALGWRDEDIEVIDSDLGLTATASQHREGFKELVAKITLGQVGVVLSYEVQRLSRNLTDWYPLLDLCRYKGCLIADRDGIYDPGTQNGRLLLGLKGTISEAEIFTIRSRMTAGLLNKAQRGELEMRLPVGFVRDESGRVQKDPDREIQHRLDFVFRCFLETRAASKVLHRFTREHLLLPRRDRFGDAAWRRPTIASLLAVLRNPAYAGAFVYGRTRKIRRLPTDAVARQRKLPREEWKIVVRDKYPAYVDWETFVRIQDMLDDNYAEYSRRRARGVPRDGSAMLHGIAYCGECGHKLVVQYKPTPVYLCQALRNSHGLPVCQRVLADPVDAKVIAAFFEALAPAELDVSARAVAAEAAMQDGVERARAQQIERLRYQAALAERQFTRADPDNRLVTAELEARWEAALRELREAETEAAAQATPRVVAQEIPPQVLEAFSSLGTHLPGVWEQGLLTRQQKKGLLRCLIEKVVIRRPVRERLEVRIVWRGGETTTLEVAMKIHTFRDLSTGEELERTLRELFAAGYTDEQIASRLAERGLRTPQHETITGKTVEVLRHRFRLLRRRSPSPPEGVKGYLTVPHLAEALGVPRWWIYDRIRSGWIEAAKDDATGRYRFPDRPDTLERLRQVRVRWLRELERRPTHDRRGGEEENLLDLNARPSKR